MAVTSTPLPERAHALRRPSPWALVIGGLLGVLALGMRFIALDHRPVMHDESMFAYYAYQFFTDGRYTHQPILHGPVQMLGLGWFFHLFGDTTAVARGFIACCSILLLLGGWCVLPRRWRWAGALLLITSPTILYYSRYLHEEIIFNAALLLALTGLARQRTRGWRGPLWAALGPIGLLFLLAVKINALFVYAAGATFLLAWFVVRVFWPRTGEALISGGASGRTETTTKRSIRAAVRPPFDWHNPLPWLRAHYPRTMRFLTVLFRRIGYRVPRWSIWLGWATGLLLGLLVLVVLFGQLSEPAGRTPETQGLHTRLFGDPTTLLPGQVAPEPTALTVAVWNVCASWSYWLGQHTQHRIEGPIHYYLPLLLVYELPLLLALLMGLVLDAAHNARRAIYYAAWPLGWLLLWSLWRALPHEGLLLKLMKFLHILPNGSMLLLGLLISVVLPWAILMLRERRTLAAWIGWWLACSLFQYSSAGEKVPWLVVHITLPMVLMLPWLWLPWLRRRERRVALHTGSRPGVIAYRVAAGAVAVAALIALRNDYYLLGPRAADPRERIVYNHTTPEFDAYCKATVAFWNRPQVAVPAERRRVLLVGDPGWPGVWYFHERFELVGNKLEVLNPGVDLVIATPTMVETLLVDSTGAATDPPGWRVVRLSLRDHWMVEHPKEDHLRRWWNYYWWREIWEPECVTFPVVILERLEGAVGLATSAQIR